MNWIFFAIAGSVAQLIDGALGMGFGLTSSTFNSRRICCRGIGGSSCS